MNIFILPLRVSREGRFFCFTVCRYVYSLNSACGKEIFDLRL